MTNGFSLPLANSVHPISDEIHEAQFDLSPKRSMTRSLLYKSTTDVSVSPGDLVEVYLKLEGDKRVKCLSYCTVLYFDDTI